MQSPAELLTHECERVQSGIHAADESVHGRYPPMAVCVPGEGQTSRAQTIYMNRPILVMVAEGHPKRLTIDEAVYLRNMLDLAINEAPVKIEKRKRECSPIPAVSDAALKPCHESPGVEFVVAEMVNNGRAYHVREMLERRGYRCRCKKLREGCHAVYATWGDDEALREVEAA